MSTDRFYDPGVLVRVGATADDAIGGLFLLPLGSITAEIGNLHSARHIQNAYSLPQLPAWIAPVANIVAGTKFMKGQASSLYGMNGGGTQYFIAPGQPQPSISFFPPIRLPTDAMTLSVRLNGAHHIFDEQPDGKRDIFPFYDYPQTVRVGAKQTVIELGVKRDVGFRQIYVHDRYGNQEAIVHVSGPLRVTLAQDCCSYSVDDSPRLCVGKVWRVAAGPDGEIVILHPSSAPQPHLNTYRFNKDGTLRWQLGPREFRPNDQILSAQFLTNGNVRVRAWNDLWSAEVDDASGSIVQIVDKNER